MEDTFEQVTHKTSDKSSVWHYFLRSANKLNAKCTKCQKVLKCTGGCTSGLQKHLKLVHQIHLNANKEVPQNNELSSAQTAHPSTSKRTETREEIPRKKTKLTDYYVSESNPSMELMVSRMTAMNGYPFSTFVESMDQRMLFKKAGYTLPKTANSIKNIVVKESDKMKEKLIGEIKILLKEGRKYSISFDEWTSIRNRRYISLNLHSQHWPEHYKNLGLIRVYGSLPAKKCVEEIRLKLREFGISLERDIIAATTDGCSMMLAFGKYLMSYHQKCIAHALQLAIIDVFYKKNNPIPNPDDLGLGQSSDDDDLPLSELSKKNIEETDEVEASDNDSDEDTDGIELKSSNTVPLNEQQFAYQDLISKVKKVTKLFRKSPTKNDDILQKYVVADFKKEYSLTTDSKTRWSSLANTLERFLKLRTCIVKALIDVKSDVSFTEEDWKTMAELYEILDIIRTILEALCRRDSTILTADVAIKFAIKKLAAINTRISEKMSIMLKKRYKDRRLPETAILTYLQNPDMYFSTADEDDLSVFARPSSEEMCRRIVALVNRTNVIEHEEPELESSQWPLQSNRDEERNKSKIEELNAELQKATTSKRKTMGHSNDLHTNVRIEMALYENGGDRGRYLSQVYDHLLSIPPTSVEPERVFSSAGLLCNKIRSRLSDESLDALVFLRAYYKEQEDPRTRNK